MKITFIIDHMSIGGAQRVCYNLITWLQSNTSEEVSLLIYRKLSIGDVYYDLSHITHYFLDKGTFGKIRSIHRFLKKIGSDVVISFGVPNAMYDVIGNLGLNTKHIVCERNDPSHFRGKYITRILSRQLMKKADGFVFQTKEAQKFYGGNIAKRSVIIPNPLFISEQSPKAIYDGVREREIVSAGRLNKQKNHALLIRAFANIVEKYPDYRLIIYGEGPERKNDETLIQSLSLIDKVRLPGAINDVPNAIYKSSIFVLSSDFEGMPNALMEAMAMGLPCVSTDCPCGGSKELIENTVNGLLFPVGDEESLVNSIIYLIENPDIAKKLGNKAFEIREKMNLDILSRKWYDFFVQIVNK